MNLLKPEITYQSIMKIIESEYKDFDKEFALTHYIKRQKSIYDYNFSPLAAKKITTAFDLLYVFGVAKNKFMPGVTDFVPVKLSNKKIFTN